MDDQTDFESMNNHFNKKYNEVIEEVEWNDSHRQHSKDKLTADENLEVSLFHSFKQDPFYKHHLRTHLAKQAEDFNQNIMSMHREYHEVDPDDQVKFDRINLFDFRRTLPHKEREPKIDNKGRAWGSGKRKNAIAVANVKAGNGKITVNHRPLLQYFLMPSQRQRILLPLTVTQYTCLVDINITVRGGGTTG